MKRGSSAFCMVLVVAGLLLGGCSSMGPRSVVRDRFDYTRAISDSWKTQMLFNIVGVRYGEIPIFLEVASVISQYEAETQANATASWQTPLVAYNNINANTLTVGGSGKYTDRPTITYNPLSGERLASALMKPIPPSSLLSLVQSGFPVDIVFRLTLQSVNGLENQYGGTGGRHHANPGFFKFIEKWKELHATGAIMLRARKKADEEEAVIVFKSNVSREAEAEGAELKRLLRLDPGATEFKIVYGAVAMNDREIAILSRSVLQMMTDLASQIEVPESHAAESYVAPTFTSGDTQAPTEPLMRVRCSTDRPANAFAAVPYQDHWFWIENRDLRSKHVFSFVTLVFTLTETGVKTGIPIVTIPAR